MLGSKASRIGVLLPALVLLACTAVVAPRPQAGLPPMPTPRRALGVAFHQGALYATGGWNGESTQLAAVEVYDPATGQWAAGPALTHPRSQHGLVSTGDRLWAVGGWSASEGLVTAVEALNATGAWRTVTHLPTPRREPGVALFEGEIVVAGGFDGWNDGEADGYLGRVEAYDPAADAWRPLASLQQPRRGLSLVVAGDSLYAIGGYGPPGEGFLKTVERYVPAADRWERLAWPLAPRTWAAAVAVPGAGNAAIVIAGGYNAASYLDLVELVDLASGEVCHGPPLPVALAWAGSAVVAGDVLLAGGETAEGFSGVLTKVVTECSF